VLEKEACLVGAMARFLQVRISRRLWRSERDRIERAAEKTASEACSGRTDKRR